MLFHEKLGHDSQSVGSFSILYSLGLLITTFNRSGALRVVAKIYSPEDLVKQFRLYVFTILILKSLLGSNAISASNN